MNKISINTGDVFNRLTVIEELNTIRIPSGQTKRYFSFRCDCGNLIDALLDNVRRNKIKSCGCLNQENKEKHNLSAHPLAKIWYGMHDRCLNNTDYHDRGIRVCDDWSGEDGLTNFISWSIDKNYNSGLEIDRKNNNGNYTPDNCHFTTGSINQRNKRNALKVEHPVTKESISLLTLWENEGNPNISWSTVRSRYLYSSWSVLDSINKPAWSRL